MKTEIMRKENGFVAYCSRDDGSKIGSGDELKIELSYRKDNKTYNLYVIPATREGDGWTSTYIQEGFQLQVHSVARKSKKGMMEAMRKINSNVIVWSCQQFNIEEEDGMQVWEAIDRFVKNYE